METEAAGSVQATAARSNFSLMPLNEANKMRMQTQNKNDSMFERKVYSMKYPPGQEHNLLLKQKDEHNMHLQKRKNEQQLKQKPLDEATDLVTLKQYRERCEKLELLSRNQAKEIIKLKNIINHSSSSSLHSSAASNISSLASDSSDTDTDIRPNSTIKSGVPSYASSIRGRGVGRGILNPYLTHEAGLQSTASSVGRQQITADLSKSARRGWMI